MTIKLENTQNGHPGLISITILEKLVSKLLVHRECDALRLGFIELIEDWHHPKCIELFVDGQRGLMMHRGQSLADIVVYNMLDPSSPRIVLSQYENIYAAAESQATHILTTPHSSNVDLYVPLMLGDTVSAILVVKSISFEPDNKLVWEQMLSAYTYLNQMLYSAEIDPLTGLMNRLAFERLMNKLAVDNSPSLTKKHAVYFALADIDFFKRINDNFGHLYGDEVLILLARSMAESFRSVDWLFRYGGEEFAIVLHGTTQQEAYQALERFRIKVENTLFPQVEKVTVSIGFSRMVQLEPTVSLIDRADHALYYAKNQGRNQVLFYEDLLAQKLLDVAEQETGEI